VTHIFLLHYIQSVSGNHPAS